VSKVIIEIPEGSEATVNGTKVIITYDRKRYNFKTNLKALNDQGEKTDDKTLFVTKNDKIHIA
jgi:hypothetical protein